MLHFIQTKELTVFELSANIVDQCWHDHLVGHYFFGVQATHETLDSLCRIDSHRKDSVGQYIELQATVRMSREFSREIQHVSDRKLSGKTGGLTFYRASSRCNGRTQISRLHFSSRVDSRNRCPFYPKESTLELLVGLLLLWCSRAKWSTFSKWVLARKWDFIFDWNYHSGFKGSQHLFDDFRLPRKRTFVSKLLQFRRSARACRRHLSVPRTR